APSLRDLYTRATLATGQPVSDQTVAAHVRDGSAGMPAYTPAVISDADMSDLLMYLREKCGTFPTGGGCFDEHNPPANPHYRAN
ncbi:MAG: cytochrome c, partial [Vicinamibacterales bacterium]